MAGLFSWSDPFYFPPAWLVGMSMTKHRGDTSVDPKDTRDFQPLTDTQWCHVSLGKEDRNFFKTSASESNSS